MASILCPGCGNDVIDTAPRCPRCLKPIAFIPTEPKPPSRADGMRAGALLVLNLIVLFGFLFAIAVLTS
jgi:hypothetical protein